MNLTHLETFLKVAQLKNFSGALRFSLPNFEHLFLYSNYFHVDTI